MRGAISRHFTHPVHRSNASCGDSQPGSASTRALSASRNSSAKMLHRACRLLAADHREMVLQPVEPGEENDAGFVEPRRRRKDVAAEGNGGFEQLEKLVFAAAPKRRERCGSGWCNGIEDAEQRVGVALLVARDQLGIVESSPVYMRTPAGSRRRIAISFSLRAAKS